MSVKKIDNCEAYQVSKDGESATIIIRCWESTYEDGKIRYCGEILIHSSFGSWGNYWGACGVPFKRFLIKLDFNYLFTKLMGCELEEYDGYKTVMGLQQRLLEMRRKHQLDKEAAKELWRQIDDHREEMEGSLESFVRCCGRIQSDVLESWNSPCLRDCKYEIEALLGEPWNWAQDRPKPGATGFWKYIWPEFIGALKAEAEATALAPKTVTQPT